MKRILTLLMMACVLSAGAQIYPYIENYETFTQFTAIGTQNGYKSDMSVYPRGINGTNCVQAQMSQFNHRDTIVSPLIGPITANTEAYFYYRIVTYIASVEAPYTLSSNENVVVQMGIDALNIYNTYYTINASSHTPGTGFVRVNMSVTLFAGNPGNYKFIVNSPGNNDWYFHLDSVVIRERPAPPAALAVSDSVVAPRCHAVCDGTVFLNASGGVQPYTYLWSNGADSAVLTNVCAGTYTVTVTDNAQSTVSASVTVTQPDALTATVAAIPETCFGACNGSVAITAAGGTGPYAYAWNNSTNNATANNLCVGPYTATVTDAHTCTVSVNAAVSGPAVLGVVVDSATVLTGNTVHVTATGGTTPYAYLWNDGNNNASRSFDTAGVYACVVCDANNCCDSVDVSALLNTGIREVAGSRISLLNTVVSNQLLLVADEACQLEMISMEGKHMAFYTVEKGKCSLDVAALPAGVYMVAVSGAGPGMQRIVKY